MNSLMIVQQKRSQLRSDIAMLILSVALTTVCMVLMIQQLTK